MQKSNAMKKICNNKYQQEKERMKNLARELSCTCINKGQIPFKIDKGTGSGISKTLEKILASTSGGVNYQKQKPKERATKDIIMNDWCSCLNDEKGKFDCLKIPFEINVNNPKGAAILNEVEKCMRKNVCSIVPIIDRLNIDPNVVMPKRYGFCRHLSEGCVYAKRVDSYFTSLFGCFVRHVAFGWGKSKKSGEYESVFVELLKRGGIFKKKDFNKIRDTQGGKIRHIMETPHKALNRIIDDEEKHPSSSHHAILSRIDSLKMAYRCAKCKKKS